jgi:CHASE2 domain-containing sensor protein
MVYGPWSVFMLDGMLDEIAVQVVEVVLALALYFLPAIIADRRKRHDLLLIALFTACVGWTGIGWLIAMRWAFLPNPPVDLASDVVRKRRVVSMRAFSQALTDRIARRADRRG